MERGLKISLAFSLIGILLLLLLAQGEVELVSIKEVKDGNFINKNVKISGEVLGERSYNSLSFKVMRVKDSSGEIDVTCNCGRNYTGLYLEIVGKVSEYNKEMQINANRIVERME